MPQNHAPLLDELTAAQAALDTFATKATGDKLERIADRLGGVLQSGGKVLACGNGGSSADAMHFCEELTGRFRDDRPHRRGRLHRPRSYHVHRQRLRLRAHLQPLGEGARP